MKITIQNESELEQVAVQLAPFLKQHNVVALRAEMGTGKTTFTKALCKYLGVEDPVTSPTFSIVNEYDGKDQKVYHFDFYRLETIDEAYEMGYEDYFYSDAICIVEWPEKIEELLPEDALNVSINNELGKRTFEWKG